MKLGSKKAVPNACALPEIPLCLPCNAGWPRPRSFCQDALLETVGEQFRTPLLRALQHDLIALTVLGTGQAPPLAKLDHTQRPAVVVLVDDDDATRVGPNGWRYAARVMRWARGAFLHGTGGTPQHYELAVLVAQQVRHLVLVETSSNQLDAWQALALRSIPPKHIVRIEPPNGGVHPVPTPRSAMQ